MGDLFPEDGQDDLPENALAELVGEGKKFKDNEALAKGKLESDRFISQVQKENEELRKELNKRISAAEVAVQITEQMKQRSASNATPTPGADERDDDEAGTALSEDNVEEIVEKKLTAHQQKQVLEANLRAVRAELEKAWGAGATTRLKQVCAELGLGEDFANGFAAQKPQAFLKLVLGTKTTSSVDTSPPRSERRTPGVSTGQKRYKDYDQLRRDNPKEYFSARVQNEMYKLAQEDPDFYN